MTSIINLMEELQYPTNKSGVCLGLAYMAERARRCGLYGQFENRMNYLDELGHYRLKGLIEELHEKIKQFGPDENAFQLNDEERILLSIEPFFWQIWAHFNPNEIRKFLTINGPFISQTETLTLENLFYATDSDDKTLATLNPPKKHFIRAGNEENQGDLELQKFFKTLLKYKHLSTGSIIHSGNHAIHVFYDKEKNQWTLTNHDRISHFDDIQTLAKAVIPCFSSNGLANLAIYTFTDEAPEKTSSLFSELDEISNESIKLISENSKINSTDSYNNTALHVLAIANMPEATKKLLAVEGIDAFKKSSSHQSPLFDAIFTNSVQTVRELFASGKIDPNVLKETKPFLLSIAATNGFSEIVEELLKQYDKHNIALPNKKPFLSALDNGHTKVAELLLKSGKIYTNSALHLAVLTKDRKAASELLATGRINVNTVSDLGSVTPLHIAAAAGDVEIVRMILQKKELRVNESDMFGTSSPLIEAIRKGHIAIVRELLEHKHINVLFHGQNSTALGNAIVFNRADCVVELLKKPDIEINEVAGYFSRDDIDKDSTSYYTYLAMAIKENNVEIVKLLRNDPRIDINKTEDKGPTTLYLAVKNNNKEIVQELLKHKNIDVNKGNPLAMALNQGDFEIAKLLLNHPKINVNQLDADGNSPLYLAMKNGDVHSKELVFAILANAQIETVETPSESSLYVLDYLETHCQVFYYMQPLVRFINSLETELNRSKRISNDTKAVIDDIRNTIKQQVNSSKLDEQALSSIHEQLSKLLGNQIKGELSTLNHSSQGLFSVNTSAMMNKFSSDFNAAKNESSNRLETGIGSAYTEMLQLITVVHH
ncbi:ankyrin repeat protein [Legionella massiliensis]|uniref:Ankyrin repeat protein n=1 Tax=Legionella massiliensis TaxID=1034943 RepID=A0A078KT02_9GAMM|nr:ankyrin repeat domain-containing protein [Legionella massiliensis]CDZ77565.1 ankyrin repeat protein [Legionella massiliensis]CEE13303.1 Ankyrin repeats (3 copies) [Legionella massiliensis]